MNALCLTLLLLSQDPLSGFPDPWERFKEGSWVKIKKIMKGPQGTHEIVQTQTLGTPEQGQTTLTVVTEIGGEKREEMVVLPKLLGPDAKTKKTDKGSETLKVDGKDYACKVTLTESEGMGIMVSTTTWEAEGAGLLKVVTDVNQSGLAWKTSSSAVKVGEKAKIGGQEVACTVYEVSVDAGPQKVTGKNWISLEVPGLIVKSRTTITMQTGPDTKIQTEVSVEALGFEVQK